MDIESGLAGTESGFINIESGPGERESGGGVKESGGIERESGGPERESGIATIRYAVPVAAAVLRTKKPCKKMTSKKYKSIYRNSCLMRNQQLAYGFERKTTH